MRDEEQFQVTIILEANFHVEFFRVAILRV